MKDKNKKILKGLGVGALALGGMFAFTGCENINVSQEKIDSLIEIAESADGFTSEQLDLMRQQIALLEEQNDYLIEQKDELEKNNQELKNQNDTLIEQNELLADQNEKFDANNEVLENQNALLEAQNLALAEQKEILENSNSSLEEQLEALETINSILQQQKESLTNHNNLLESQNEILEDKLAKLEEQIEILKEQNKLLEEANRLTKEEVWNLAQTADFNLIMNVGGIRDNLKYTAATSDVTGEFMAEVVFYNSNDVKFFAECYDSSVELWYQKDGQNICMADIEKFDDEYACGGLDVRQPTDIFEDCVGIYRGSLPTINTFELTYDDLSHYEILENGNVKLTFVKYEYNYNDGEEENEGYEKLINIATFEYSTDAKIQAISFETKVLEVTDEYEGFITPNYAMAYTVSYGEVDSELLESWVELAEGYEELKTRALALADIAESKSYDNFSSTWTSVFEDQQTNGEMKYFVNETMSSIFVSGEDGTKVGYKLGDGEIYVANLIQGQNGYVCDEVNSWGTDDFAEFVSEFGDTLVTRESYDLTDDDLLYCKELSNGNIQVAYSVYNFEDEDGEYCEYKTTYVFEYSQDEKLVSVQQKFEMRDDDEEPFTTILNMKNDYQYGTVESEEIEELIELAEAKRNEQ